MILVVLPEFAFLLFSEYRVNVIIQIFLKGENYNGKPRIKHRNNDCVQIAQVLRIGRNTAYQFVRLAYEDTENYFQVVKIGQQYRAITSSFFDWLNAKR